MIEDIDKRLRDFKENNDIDGLKVDGDVITFPMRGYKKGIDDGIIEDNIKGNGIVSSHAKLKDIIYEVMMYNDTRYMIIYHGLFIPKFPMTFLIKNDIGKIDISEDGTVTVDLKDKVTPVRRGVTVR